jgi:hypothetical protein
MPYEQAPQPTPDEAYERNHLEIVDIARSYRNDRPRTPELVGKQEKFKAMLIAALEYWRTGDA